jgi:hypothetical protein
MKRLSMGLVTVTIFCVIFAEHLILSKTRSLADTSITPRGLGDYTFSKQNFVHWDGKRDLKHFMQAYFHEGNAICNLSSNTLVNITFGCKRLYETSGLGSGNFVAGFYAIRLAALMKGNIDVNIQCPDALEQRDSLLLPWMTGHFPASVSTKEKLKSIMEQYNVPKHDICGTIDKCPIGVMFQEIQYDLRRMAVSLVGIPDEHHPSHTAVKQWLSQHEHQKFSKPYQMNLAISDTPLYPNTELDDVIVHFRCGDLMSSSHPRFGFCKYNAFASRISPNATRIGIVTQPFDESAQNRAWDSSAEKRRRCKTVVLDFQNYLETKFPNAKVRIHNSPNETIALTYARMIMANQSIAGISTFGVFSSIASFGTGYIRSPDKQSATNQWLTNPPLDKLTNDLILMKEPNILMVQQVQKLWEEKDGKQKILSWFRDSSIMY